MAHEPGVEIFSIGTELVMGRIQDTNAFWMAQELVDLGALMRRITVLPDDIDRILEALEGAVQRHTDVVLTSGGLGPTPDDLTVQALSTLVGVQPVVHEPTLEAYIRRRNLRGRGELTQALLRMATVPTGAQVYQNPAGWAPCVSVTKGATTFFALPGPPPEMQAVFTMHIYLKGYIALGGLDSPLGLPLDIIARSTAEAPAETILQQAVAYLSGLVATKGRTLRNL